MSQNNALRRALFQHKSILISTTLNINPIDKDMLLNKEAFELFPKCDKKIVDLCDFTFEGESIQIIFDYVVDIISLK